MFVTYHVNENETISFKTDDVHGWYAAVISCLDKADQVKLSRLIDPIKTEKTSQGCAHSLEHGLKSSLDRVMGELSSIRDRVG